MRRVLVYLIRVLLAAAGYAAVVHVSHGSYREFESSFGASPMSVCAVLVFCSLCGWLLRTKRAPLVDAGASALIAVVVTLCFLYIPSIGAWMSRTADRARAVPTYSSAADDLNSQTFHKQSFLVDFDVIAPVSVAIFTGLLCFLPERRRGLTHFRVRGLQSAERSPEERQSRRSNSSRGKRRRRHRS